MQLLTRRLAPRSTRKRGESSSSNCASARCASTHSSGRRSWIHSRKRLVVPARAEHVEAHDAVALDDDALALEAARDPLEPGRGTPGSGSTGRAVGADATRARGRRSSTRGRRTSPSCTRCRGGRRPRRRASSARPARPWSRAVYQSCSGRREPSTQVTFAQSPAAHTSGADVRSASSVSIAPFAASFRALPGQEAGVRHDADASRRPGRPRARRLRPGAPPRIRPSSPRTTRVDASRPVRTSTPWRPHVLGDERRLVARRAPPGSTSPRGSRT